MLMATERRSITSASSGRPSMLSTRLQLFSSVPARSVSSRPRAIRRSWASAKASLASPSRSAIRYDSASCIAIRSERSGEVRPPASASARAATAYPTARSPSPVQFSVLDPASWQSTRVSANCGSDGIPCTPSATSPRARAKSPVFTTALPSSHEARARSEGSPLAPARS